jgi:hypothetical protein
MRHEGSGLSAVETRRNQAWHFRWLSAAQRSRNPPPNPQQKRHRTVPQDTQISLSQQNLLEAISASHLTLEAIYFAPDSQLNSCISVE